MKALIASLRVVATTIAICVVGYLLLVLALAQSMPGRANGSLVVAPDGAVVGSSLIAQPFVRPEYFWPRPSAVDYNAAGAGGSNKSPTSPDLTERARQLIERHGATAERPLPPELATASGGGLDPHVSVHAARYQAPRVAAARGLALERVDALIEEHAFAPGGALTSEPLVNVLALNLALDQEAGAKPAR